VKGFVAAGFSCLPGARRENRSPEGAVQESSRAPEVERWRPPDGWPDLWVPSRKTADDGTRKPAVQGRNAVREKRKMPRRSMRDEQGQDLVVHLASRFGRALAAAALFMSASSRSARFGATPVRGCTRADLPALRPPHATNRRYTLLSFRAALSVSYSRCSYARSCGRRRASRAPILGRDDASAVELIDAFEAVE